MSAAGPPQGANSAPQRQCSAAPGRCAESLGVIPPGGIVRVPLTAPAGESLTNIPALAVSLEPAGGSPTGQPTGPVLYSGVIERMY